MSSSDRWEKEKRAFIMGGKVFSQKADGVECFDSGNDELFSVATAFGSRVGRKRDTEVGLLRTWNTNEFSCCSVDKGEAFEKF